MRPKGKLFALLAVFAAIGLVTASGAFTTVQADRTATVTVNGDNNALISISTPADAPAGVNVSNTGGEAVINLGNASTGLNSNATTILSPVANITNNGNEDVTVTVSVSSSNGLNSASAVNASSTDLGPGDTTQFGLELDVPGGSVGQSFDLVIEIDANDTDDS
ncbi:hypothetical protein GRX01_06410 [Halobaculum sp. WSA2]|uniref:DUF1102 domain-containing protein n=1 Tax=Halobaculum saliterrae TaxID=2073113 RepID=A0A6B0SWG5_9EURY|nr:hypothetical protein [Halobaculum saliterrae]MXR40973.1 hypothetical protein [Halobaculum saliterrae]